MEFDLPDHHRLLQRTVREFAEQEIAPVAEELDRTHAFPYDIVRRLGELDLMGIPFPEEYGGAGSDSLAYALVVEELARVDSSVAITLCAHTSLGTQPIYLFGNEAQKQEWLPRLCSGERLGAFGLTEPEAGSDAGNTRTRASLENGEWVINGSKQFITNAGTDISGVVVITAVTGTGHGADGRGGERTPGEREISNLIVANGTPGYEPGEPYRKMGWNASDTRPLTFADCRVPGGEPGRPARRRLSPVPQRARHRPDRGRRDGRRPRPGRARPGARLRQGAPRVRPPDLEVPGDPEQAREHGDRDRGDEAARAQVRVPEGQGRRTSR